MHQSLRLFKVVVVILALLCVLINASVVEAVPTSFTWGSFNSTGLTTYGVYDTDNTTILQTGDLSQFIWAGPNGTIDPPQCNGAPGGDDRLLDTAIIQNTGSLPPPARNRGYIPLKTYSFDTLDPQSGGVVYIRAWNASTIDTASAYGDSATGTLTAGGSYNAPRWYTNDDLVTATWNGPADGNWQTPSNWTTGIVPGSLTCVVIPAGSRLQLSADAATKGLSVGNGATLNLVTFTISVEEPVNNGGTLRQTRNVLIGSTTEFLRFTNASGNADNYRGVDITPTEGTGMGLTTVQIMGNQSACTTVPTDPLIHRCYRVDPTVATSATIRFWYTEAERNDQAANALILWHWSPWTRVGGPGNYSYSESGTTCISGSGLACWFQVTGVSTYSPFGLGSGAVPTAITLKTFNATQESSLPWIWIGLGVLGMCVLGLVFYGLARRLSP